MDRLAWRVLAVGASVVLALAGCSGEADDAERLTAPDGQPIAWERIPESPLGARSHAAATAVDDVILVVGGVPFLDQCSESEAECTGREETPLADGAVFDTASEQWRPISPAPVGFWRAQTVVIDDDVYVWAWDANRRAVLLRYSVGDDRWVHVPVQDQGSEIARMGNTVVVYSGGTDTGPPPLAALDPSTNEWVRLPAGPIGPSIHRSVL